MIPNAYSNYKRTIEMANELDEMARELTSIAQQDFEGIMTGLGLSWKGENAEKYIRKCSSVKEEMLDTAKQLRGIVADLRADASKMKAAQEAQAAQATRAAQQAASAIGAAVTVSRPTPPIEDVLEDVVDNVGKAAQSIVGSFGNPMDRLQDVMDDVMDDVRAAIGANAGNVKPGGGGGSR